MDIILLKAGHYAKVLNGEHIGIGRDTLEYEQRSDYSTTVDSLVTLADFQIY
jgi:hypothetical protein